MSRTKWPIALAGECARRSSPLPLWANISKEAGKYSIQTETKDLKADLAIVGGGITGLLAAEAISSFAPEMHIVLLESREIGSGASGSCLGKISALHQQRYAPISTKYGRDMAHTFAQFNTDGLKHIRNLVDRYDIQCDWENRDAVVYADTEQNLPILDEEFKAAENSGLDVSWRDNAKDLPFKVYASITLRDQAQVNPLDLCRGIARAISSRKNCRIFENTRIEQFSEGFSKHKLITSSGISICANQIIFASGMPITDRSLHFASVSPSRSYASAFLFKDDPDRYDESIEMDMCSNISGDHFARSFRSAREGRILIISGENQSVGSNIYLDTRIHYDSIQAFASENWKDQITGPIYNWSMKDFVPVDGLPYVGYLHVGSQSLFTATGFSNWGFAQAGSCAMAFKDLVNKKRNVYSSAFSAARICPIGSAQTIFQQQKHFAKHLFEKKLMNKLSINTMKIADIGCDEGGIVNYKGKILGVYRNPEGKYFAVSPSCTHLGCTLIWNNAERSWDCPCHGSQFDYEGNVRSGPATRNLKDCNEYLMEDGHPGLKHDKKKQH
jgi:glycine/D-amino acid oxidase-like deaminating enzyme/nitrite reductase/ring-hydroxylating ferredoxin subunit